MVISHVNAQTENGMDWLNNIVVPGLRKGAAWNKWNVEVHGGEVEESVEEDDSIEPGPAVYIIHKGEAVKMPENPEDDAYLPTISLQFYSY